LNSTAAVAAAAAHAAHADDAAAAVAYDVAEKRVVRPQMCKKIQSNLNMSTASK
jgi:hypothetical protein